MSTARPVESRLPEILEGISAPRTPDYFDDILGQVGRTRQRPGWSFPERWLPMTALSERVATAPRIPMRMAVVLALLLLTLAVSIVLIAGSQRPSVPAPFGIAGNGEVVFADQTGAIVAGNVSDGSTRIIVPGEGHARPVFSPDGRWLAYLQDNNARLMFDVVVADPDGASPRVIGTLPTNFGHFGWTPDSARVVAVTGGRILAFDRNGAADPTVLANGVDQDDGSFDAFNANITDMFRPPKGDEILFIGGRSAGTGIYRLAVGGDEPIPVITDKTSPIPGSYFSSPQWAPDGSKIAFSLDLHYNVDDYLGRAWVINADGTGLERVSTFDASPTDIVAEGHVSWSPDGSRVAFQRWINHRDGVDVRPVVVVDLATHRETEMANVEVNGYGGWSWSPDGASILQVPNEQSADAGAVLVLDASTGERRTIGWTGDFGQGASWQRTVPQS